MVKLSYSKHQLIRTYLHGLFECSHSKFSLLDGCNRNNGLVNRMFYRQVKYSLKVGLVKTRKDIARTIRTRSSCDEETTKEHMLHFCSSFTILHFIYIIHSTFFLGLLTFRLLWFRGPYGRVHTYRIKKKVYRIICVYPVEKKNGRGTYIKGLSLNDLVNNILFLIE